MKRLEIFAGCIKTHGADRKQLIKCAMKIVQRFTIKSTGKKLCWSGWLTALGKNYENSLIVRLLTMDQKEMGETLKSLYSVRKSLMQHDPVLAKGIMTEQIDLIKAMLKNQ